MLKAPLQNWRPRQPPGLPVPCLDYKRVPNRLDNFIIYSHGLHSKTERENISLPVRLQYSP